MVFKGGLYDENGNILFRKEENANQSEMGMYLKNIGTVFLGAYLAACGGSDVTGPDGNPTPPAGNVNISGKIVTKGEHKPVGGCGVTYTGKSGQGVKTVISGTDGSYSADDMPRGDYMVAVQNCGNVPHTEESVTVGDGKLNFTVMPKNAMMYGAMLDDEFLAFFEQISRSRAAGVVGATSGGIMRWSDENPLREYYLVTDGLSPNAASRFMRVLQETVAENYPKANCGRRYTGSFNSGPSNGDAVSGTNVIRYTTDVSGAAVTLNNGNTINGMLTLLNLSFMDRLTDEQIEYAINHEVLGHGSGMADVYTNPAFRNGRFKESVMNHGNEFTSDDVLANCMALDSGTAPGNKAPDMNPSHPAAMAAMTNSRANEIQEIGDSGLFEIPHFAESVPAPRQIEFGRRPVREERERSHRE